LRFWSTAASPAAPLGAYQQEYARSADEAVIGEVDFSPSIANSLSLIGNVGQTPELKFLEGGNKVVSMPIAVRERKNAETQW
jgi:hypothetical protein